MASAWHPSPSAAHPKWLACQAVGRSLGWWSWRRQGRVRARRSGIRARSSCGQSGRHPRRRPGIATGLPSRGPGRRRPPAPEGIAMEQRVRIRSVAGIRAEQIMQAASRCAAWVPRRRVSRRRRSWRTVSCAGVERVEITRRVAQRGGGRPASARKPNYVTGGDYFSLSKMFEPRIS